MSQSEMASAAGISRRSYINKINRDSVWTVNELIAISELTGEDITISNGISTYRVKIDKE